jgi:hypothetical protein
MTKPTPILTSPRLTSLIEARDKQKANSARSRAEVWRLTKMTSPQLLDSTVTRTVDADAPTAAFIGIKTPRDKPGVLSTGTEDKNEAARKDDILKRTLAGESLAGSTDVKAQLELEHRQWAAYEAAYEHLTREIDREKTVLAKEYCKRLRPKENELMVRICKQMLELRAAYSEAYDMKRHLIDNEIYCHGIFLDLPEFLSTPNDKHSEMSTFLRAAHCKGYIKEVSELRL